MLRLSDIARQIPGSRLLGSADPPIESAVADSREAAPGALFFALQGFCVGSCVLHPGRPFIPDAVKRGASAIASDDMETFGDLDNPDRPDARLGRLFTPDARRSLAVASDLVYGHPSHALKMIGVTGTNGKTTTVMLIAASLEAAGVPAATLGTLGLGIRGTLIPADRTTPEAPSIQRTLRKLLQEGIGAVAMEISSQALDLHRPWGCAFDTAVFTNLTQDNLDFHASMEEYYQAKKKLFVDYPAAAGKPFTAVINVDDPYGARLAAETPGRVIRYGVASSQHPSADLVAENPEVTPRSVSYTARYGKMGFPVHVPIGAGFNVYNSLAAVGAGLALGLASEAIAAGLANAHGAAGRFESVSCGQPFTVIVDYAHTPDGLLNLLRSARAITANRLLAVFGCGGDRDPGKRPQMGAIAADLADQLYVTSDNPRTENPAAILSQIVAGIPAEDHGCAAVIEDRREAIGRALSDARTGDVVVIAGKGHETYQVFADGAIHFDDREVARELLKKLVKT